MALPARLVIASYNDTRRILSTNGVPYEIRTRVLAVKGRYPRPLDERDLCYHIETYSDRFHQQTVVLPYVDYVHIEYVFIW